MAQFYASQTFIGFESSFEQAPIVLVGVPFDGTTSFRPGARFAPSAIRPDSYGLETYSPYLNLDLMDYALCDKGDLDLPFGNPALALKLIKEAFTEIVTASKKPLAVGGEHLITLPILETLYAQYPDLCVIHFDAHTDLREDYCNEPLSHACVLKRAWDFLGDGRIYQFGMRSGTKAEFDWAKSHTFLQPFNLNNLETIVHQLKDKPVYLTIDLDVLDPSIFPGTGTPEPGGITFKELLEGLQILKQLNHLVGADVVELSPHYDHSNVSTAVCCKVIREVALLLAR